jgi:hypothetical protein
VVLVAVGGGGLASGVAAAIRKMLPSCRVIGVEPEGADVMRRSFEAGSPQRMDKLSTIADSLAPPMTLPMAYGLCRRYMERIVTVSDDEICRAMAVMFRDAKLAVEPAGATALAALLGPLRDELRGARTGLIVCGANIDAETYAQQLARGERLLAGLSVRHGQGTPAPPTAPASPFLFSLEWPPMKRRALLSLAARRCAGRVPWLPRLAAAQPAPAELPRTIRLVVGYPAGGTADAVARIYARVCRSAWAST